MNPITNFFLKTKEVIHIYEFLAYLGNVYCLTIIAAVQLPDMRKYAVVHSVSYSLPFE